MLLSPEEMTPELIRRALTDAEEVETGKRWRAVCPEHDGEERDLGVSLRDGRVSLTCRMGCDPATVAYLLGLGGGTDDGDEDEPNKRFGAREIVEYVEERYEITRSHEGRLLAIPKDSARVATDLLSIKHIVQRRILDELGKTPSATTVANAFELLKGTGVAAEPIKTHIRSAYMRDEGALYIDLADAEGRILRVTGDGWEVAAPGDTPVFTRAETVRALPYPAAKPAARDDYAALLGLTPDSREFRLIWGWLVAAFFDDIARPLLWATGEHGAGKTTRALMVLNMIDPAEALGKDPGKNERDDSTTAAGVFVPSFDNLQTISEATSDWICRLVTGVTITRRKLYSDGGLYQSVLRRTGIATSINLPYGLGPDAIERLITIQFPRVPKADRGTERGLAKAFADRHAEFFAVLLADIVAMMKHLQAAEDSAEDLPRMADYATTLRALDMATGGEFAAAYEAAAEAAMRERVEDDPFLSAVVTIAQGASDGEWAGTAEDLLNAVTERVPFDAKVPTTRGMRRALKNAATALREAGVKTDDRRSNGRRLIVLRWLGEPAEAGDPDEERKRQALERVARLADADDAA